MARLRGIRSTACRGGGPIYGVPRFGHARMPVGFTSQKCGSNIGTAPCLPQGTGVIGGHLDSVMSISVRGRLGAFNEPRPLDVLAGGVGAGQFSRCDADVGNVDQPVWTRKLFSR